ncbi:ribonuclease Oy-like [Aricia agestis]|uniref:ribonuclease Oy-like n=1 Tax=Aricia agestis TaxID=91739 RepID=UPI001C207017|nr:ribonuclease Oy-like [Aricia agestis]
MDWNHLLTSYIIFLALFIGTKAEDGETDNSNLLTTTPAIDDSLIARNGLTSDKCKDDPSKRYVAPAKDCFDYFTLAIFWAPGYAYKQKLRKVPIRKNIDPKWIIHGLWPSWSSGQEDPACKRSDIFFNENRFKNAKVLTPLPGDNNLYSVLMNTWYTILEKATKNFWEHEFNKHGNCATRSSKIKDDVGYFQKTFDMYYKLNLGTTFSNARYRPGDSKKLSEIITVVNDRLKAKVKVDYTKEYVKKDNTWKAYLAEVSICLDYDLKPIDCTNLSRQENDGDLMVTYPNSVPN